MAEETESARLHRDMANAIRALSMDAVEKATGVKDPNCVGYCIGGTLLAATLAYMAQKKDDRIHSATFWAAQTDFSEAGDLQVFVDDAQLEAAGQASSGRSNCSTWSVSR